MTSNDEVHSGEIPTTVHTTDALLEQADQLTQRIKENPDFKLILDITHRVQKAAMYHTIYSMVLTAVVVIVAFIGYNTWHQSNLVEGLRQTCEQGNKDKAADLASWTFIIGLFPQQNEQTKAILESRKDLDQPIEC